uniref:EamA domain-containing protein n=1 Tax=Pyramimonas obovata TaxID=1411642 RepID=A0A7S0WS46_9CHLO|mmetsp:Transcript_37315/g.81272  ORF Transcript_37315/g.81272 Transcript_37315/m.81272 type:complete len:328 (+) Transcript_37315:127-1110(+)|eukprot:CAMPEP_0118957628 /NCGR_PEP_ID=MMETSP1169-20130426/62203_1 /TAXON_ID=36882 /ORGANISM="Pyramimonas obovata, Strain CCMP722" /LENGTH=327 /DNA_ID=CAMNT_0006905717 /DNA_START=102 /DNA_END=1085 /DNA_ORIENTATION=+
MHDLVPGVLAAVATNIFFGSFGVPIKNPQVVAAKVDPVAFQFYKTLSCFATCWLALLYVDFKFTIWGIVGAGIWVINGTLAIFAIQKAGLGIAQSVWSGLSIFVSFIWGVFIFGEPVRSVEYCFLSMILMAIGIVGLAMAAAGMFKDTKAGNADYQLMTADEDGNNKYHSKNGSDFKIGMAAAIYVGFANGSLMTPLKYANKEVTGTEYIVSFGIGAMLFTLLFVAGYSVFRSATGKPRLDFHVQVAAGPALLTGLLWSAGNFCSILTTEYFGMAVGWPIVQCHLLIATAWSIYYYEEITGRKSILVFFASAGILVLGVGILGALGK